MNENIPIYELSVLAANGKKDLNVFFLDQETEKSKAVINIPFRRNFYAVGICLRGTAELKANLETYVIKPKSLVTKPPYTINQWTFMSDDFETLTIFFTKNFISAHSSLNLDLLQFFEVSARHVFQTSDEQSANIIAAFTNLKEKYEQSHPYKNEILTNLICNLLYEIAAIYNQQSSVLHPAQNRGQYLTYEFKKLVNIHSIRKRSVKFYAENLFITSKHLSETVKETTGKTAGEWIAESAISEAKVLLQNPALTASQISEILQFPDLAAFSRFFKKNAGLSPSSYKQSF